MEEPSPILEPPAEAKPAAPMSLAGRLTTVFSAPGDVFDSVKQAPPSVANWLTPAALLVLVSWIGAWVIFAQPALQHQLTEVSERAVEKTIAKRHLSKEQAEQARQMSEKWAGLGTKITAVAAPVLLGILLPVWWGLLLWLAGTKGLKAKFSFFKAIEVAGLANMIGVLAAILKTLLILIMENLFASPSLVLLVKDFDPQNPAHTALGAIDIMTFWFLAVVAVGLGRLSGASWAKAAVWVFGMWFLYTAVRVGIAFGLQAAFGG